jgi:ribosomal protein S18 acetylase RimI-like enzyme
VRQVSVLEWYSLLRLDIVLANDGGFMAITSRPYAPDTDRQPVLDLLAAARAVARYDRYPTAHRLELLLASRLWEPERDARVWRDETVGRLVGFAMLWRRGREEAHSGIEIVSHPAADRRLIEEQALTLAVERTTGRARELGRPAYAGYGGGAEETDLFSLLEHFGFASQVSYNVYMGRPLETLPAELTGAADCTIRPLAGEDELDAYAALYEQIFVPVSPALRRTLLTDPDYAQFVAIAPDGTPIGFCECSVSRNEWPLGGRRTGWIDYVGTLSGHRERGIGQALLLAAMRQLHAWGAERVALLTMGANERAQRVYRRMGMEVMERDYGYVLSIAP